MKVLILAYDFPPYVSVGGIRPFNWYKFLPQYNVHPVVVTRQWQNLYKDHRDYIAPGYTDERIIEETGSQTLIKTPYRPNLANRIMLKYGSSKFVFWRKLVTSYYEAAQFFFRTGPKVELLLAAEDYLKENKVDVIIATGEPFILFKYAGYLSRQYNIPWIADYRDSWTDDPTKKKNFVIRMWNSFWEKKTVSSAALIVTVSEFVEEYIFKVIKNKTSFVIPNGYDPDAVKKAEASDQQSTDTLWIGYAGTIPGWAPWESFLKVICDFVEKHGRTSVKINLYGVNIEKEIMDFVNKNPLIKDIVILHPKIPNEQLLFEFSKNNLFLLFNNYSMMGTKIYEYIALKRKILLCYSDDEEANILKEKFYHIEDFASNNQKLQEDLINYTSAGIAVKDSAHLAGVLEKAYMELRSSGHIYSNPVNFEQLSRDAQTRKLAEVIEQVKLACSGKEKASNI